MNQRARLLASQPCIELERRNEPADEIGARHDLRSHVLQPQFKHAVATAATVGSLPNSHICSARALVELSS